MTPNNPTASQSQRKEPIPPFDSKRRRFDQVKVAESAHCGLGVFATSAVKAGRAVGRVFGDVKPKDFRSSYCVEFGEEVLEPFAPYRYLNHSCSPNCEFIEWEIDNGTDSSESETHANTIELWVHALRNIEPGEELLIDYGWDWRSAIPCKCGSPNCRGWICKPEELELCIAFHTKQSFEEQAETSSSN